jgi:hypothetical protein
MRLRDFQVGKTYRMVEEDFPDPLDECQVPPGKVLVREILEPANAQNSCWDDGLPPTETDIAEWQQFLRVRNPETGRVTLLHPETLVSAEEV